MKFKLSASQFKNVSARIKKIFIDSRGSASVEFSILAIPLFIPLMIFIAQFSHSSDTQDSLRTLARESVRAFVSSPTDEIAYGVAEQIIEKGGEILGLEDIEVRIICSESPCITPDAQVLIRLLSRSSGNLKTEVSAIEYVSPWA
jgi:uncharacterized protein (UPF0333 family)